VKSNEGKRDLEERTFNFAVETVKFLKDIKYSKEFETIKISIIKISHFNWCKL